MIFFLLYASLVKVGDLLQNRDFDNLENNLKKCSEKKYLENLLGIRYKENYYIGWFEPMSFFPVKKEDEYIIRFFEKDSVKRPLSEVYFNSLNGLVSIQTKEYDEDGKAFLKNPIRFNGKSDSVFTNFSNDTIYLSQVGNKKKWLHCNISAIMIQEQDLKNSRLDFVNLTVDKMAGARIETIKRHFFYDDKDRIKKVESKVFTRKSVWDYLRLNFSSSELPSYAEVEETLDYDKETVTFYQLHFYNHLIFEMKKMNNVYEFVYYKF